MESYKKIGAIGGAISLALCWPLAVGHIGQKIIEDGVANLSNDQVESTIVEYDRSYLSSKVTTKYEIIDEQLKAQFEADELPTVYHLTSDITHGLTALSAESVIQEAQDLPLTILTTTQLNGNTDFDITLDSWQYQNSTQGMTMSTSPLAVTGSVTVLGDVNYDMSLPSVQIDFSTGEEVQLANLTGNGKGKQANGYWLGEQHVHLERLDVLDGNAQIQAALHDVDYQANTNLNETGDKLGTHVVMQAGQTQAFDGTEIEKLNLDFSVDGLDTEAFDGIMSVYSETSDPAALEAILPHVERLFDQGFTFALNNLTLDINNGSFEHQWKLEVPQGTQGVIANPMQILSVVKGDLSASVTDSLVESTPMIQQGIDELMIMELINKTEQGYELKADIAEGNVTFSNGQVFPIFTMLMPLMMQ